MNMEIINNENSIKKAARAAGLLYLIMIITGIGAQVIRSGIIVAGNAAATVDNIVASGSLFNVAFFSDMIMTVCYLLFAWVLYTILKQVNKNIALLFVILTTASVAILSLNTLNLFAATFIVNDAGYLTAFGADQVDALAMLFMDLHYHGYYIAQVSFGLWLMPLGYLVIKSGLFPKALGFMLIIATFGHLAGFTTAFLLPGYESLGDMVAILELPFGLWLLLKGAKLELPAVTRRNAAVSE